MLYSSMGDYAKAEPLHQRALEIRQKVLGSNHTTTAESLNNLAGLYRSLGDYPKAEQLYQRALEIYAWALGPDHPDTTTALKNDRNAEEVIRLGFDATRESRFSSVGCRPRRASS